MGDLRRRGDPTGVRGRLRLGVLRPGAGEGDGRTGRVLREGHWRRLDLRPGDRGPSAFVDSVQRELTEVLDEHREPATVCDRLQMYLARLRSGDVDPQGLVFRKRVSQRIDEYDQGTHTVSALLRYRENGMEENPGRDVRFVVFDDDARLPQRVRLPFEEIDRYDVQVYVKEIIRGTESLVASLGWKRDDIGQYLRDTTDSQLQV